MLSINGGTKTLYNLGLNKDAGTMSAWTKPGSSSTTRYLLASQGSDNEILHVYIDTSNKVNVAVRDSLDNWIVVVKSDAIINTTAWNFIALEWKVTAQGLQCTLNLNGINKAGTAASYKKQRGKYLAEETVKNTYSYEDKVNGSNYKYIYDASERLVNIIESLTASPNVRNVINYDYDIENNLKTFRGNVNGAGHINSYEYDKDTRIANIFYNNPYKNDGNVENFPLSGTTLGTLGTKPYSENTNFAKDDTGKTVLTPNVVTNT